MYQNNDINFALEQNPASYSTSVMKEIKRFENLEEEIKTEVRNKIKNYYENLDYELKQRFANKKTRICLLWEARINHKNWMGASYF